MARAMSMAEFGNAVLDNLEDKGYSIQNCGIIKELVFHYTTGQDIDNATRAIVYNLNLQPNKELFNV